jgi:hypothetical protein
VYKDAAQDRPQPQLSAAAWEWGQRFAASLGVVAFAGSWIRFSSLLHSAVAALMVVVAAAFAERVIAASTLSQRSAHPEERTNTVWVWFERISAVVGVLAFVAGSIAWEELLFVVLAPITIVGIVYLAACAFTAYDEGRLVGLPSWTNAGRAYGALLVPLIPILMFGEHKSTLTDIAGASALCGLLACGVFAIWIIGRSARTAINAWHQATAAGSDPDRRVADTATERLGEVLGVAGVDERAVAVVVLLVAALAVGGLMALLEGGSDVRETPDTPTPRATSTPTAMGSPSLAIRRRVPQGSAA